MTEPKILFFTGCSGAGKTSLANALEKKISKKYLPLLDPNLSLTISEPLALGKPSKNYFWEWYIYN